jgi:hypothetical protein
MATIVIKASGIVRAAAYTAMMADASLGIAPVGRTSSSFINPPMEKPLATTTFKAVSAEARPMLSADRGSGFHLLMLQVEGRGELTYNPKTGDIIIPYHSG